MELSTVFACFCLFCPYLTTSQLTYDAQENFPKYLRG